jgi:hypothetical protein
MPGENVKSKIAATVAALTLLAGSDALAQTPTTQLKTFEAYCTTGAVRTCASVRVYTLWDPTAKVTRVQMWLRNLQGSIAEDNTGGAPITRLGVTTPKLTGASGLTISTTKGAEIIGNPQAFWTISNQMIEGPVTFSTTVKTPEGGVQGCAIYPPGVQNYFRTCNDNSYVVFGFTTTNQWSAYNAEVAWIAQTTSIDQHFYACRTADPSTSAEYCESVDPTATPEPVSVALLGSGLAGLAALTRKRRKARTADQDTTV